MCCNFVSGLHSLQSRENEIQELWILAEGMGKMVLFICLLKCCLPHDCFLHCVYLFFGHAVLILSLHSYLSWVTPCAVALLNNLYHVWQHYWSFGKGKKRAVPVVLGIRMSNGKDNSVQTWTRSAPGLKREYTDDVLPSSDSFKCLNRS